MRLDAEAACRRGGELLVGGVHAKGVFYYAQPLQIG